MKYLDLHSAQQWGATLKASMRGDGGQYATLVEDPNTEPVIAALATPYGTCDLLIPKDPYDPFAIMAMVAG